MPQWFKRLGFESDDLYLLARGPWPACFTPRGRASPDARAVMALWDELGIQVSDDVLYLREATLVRAGDCHCEEATCIPHEPICSYPLNHTVYRASSNSTPHPEQPEHTHAASDIHP
jgi:hypothetical protein